MEISKLSNLQILQWIDWQVMCLTNPNCPAPDWYPVNDGAVYYPEFMKELHIRLEEHMNALVSLAGEVADWQLSSNGKAEHWRSMHNSLANIAIRNRIESAQAND